MEVVAVEKRVPVDGDKITEVRKLPPEVWRQIFLLVSSGQNYRQVQKCMRVCKEWRELAVEMYRGLCIELWNTEPNARPLFNKYLFEAKIRNDPYRCMEFYHKYQEVKNILRSKNVEEHRARITKLNCIDGITIPDNWSLAHNYRGIYDMVYVHPRNSRQRCLKTEYEDDNDFIVCSVFDTIQVWDVNRGIRRNVIRGSQLDRATNKSTCFNVTPDATRLICGTTNFKLNVHDLTTGELEESHHAQPDHNGHGIADVRCVKDEILAVDDTGKIHVWSDPGSGSSIRHVKSFCPPLEKTMGEEYEVNSGFSMPETYTRSEFSRLLDFNDDLVVVTSYYWICIASRKNKNSATFEQSKGEPMCIKLHGTTVYCGCQNGKLMEYKLRSDPHRGFYVGAAPRSLTTRVQLGEFQDAITSLDVSPDGKLVITGDVNGEITGYSTEKGRFGIAPPNFRLISHHAHRSFIWAVHMDEGRMFSGDSDGNLVIHDFFDFEPEVSNQDSDEADTVPLKKLKHL